MFIKIDLNGNILSHDYELTQDCTVEIAEQVLVNFVGEYKGIYKYKYVESALVELTEEEMAQHPLYLASQREKAIQQQLKNIEFGKRLIAIIGVMLDAKGLTNEQTAQVNSTFAAIVTLLNTGSLGTAKDAISAITPDAVILQADIDMVIAELNSYLGV